MKLRLLFAAGQTLPERRQTTQELGAATYGIIAFGSVKYIRSANYYIPYHFVMDLAFVVRTKFK